MLAAKAIVSLKRFFTCTLKQIQPETIALLQDGIIEEGSTEDYVFLGQRLPDNVNISLILKGKNAQPGGKDIELRIRKAIMSNESVELALGAKEYGSMEFKVECVADLDPYTTNPTWKCLGEIATTATTSTGNVNITVASATGIVEDMLVIGTGIPKETKVKSVVGTSVELTKAATANGTLVAVKFITEDNMKKSNVAYWLVEK